VKSESFGRSFGFEFIVWILEQPLRGVLVALNLGVLYAYFVCGGLFSIIIGSILLPVVIGAIFVGSLLAGSWLHDAGACNWSEFFSVQDAALSASYKGKKFPIEIFYEGYMASRINLNDGLDLYDVFLKRNQIFRFAFTMETVKFYVGTFMKTGVNHSQSMDKEEVAVVYDRGNEFYNYFLGERMVYTSGLWESLDGNGISLDNVDALLTAPGGLEKAQDRKLDLVCRQVQMKKGDEHLDIGCGWGTLVRYAHTNYGTKSYGITLAKEQVEWHQEQCKKLKVDPTLATIEVKDYRLLPSDKKWDVITCLEMAEYVGIKNFQKFLLQVKNLLKDDGIFYLQIAGLRRPWQYEDLVWGMFMAKYIFPAADASCPVGWVTTQAERAGWEVHRVENCGVHYSLTIKAWYNNWVSNKDKILQMDPKVGGGEKWYRMWLVFLGWSAIIAAQGSSTVFMITLTKNHKNDAMSVKGGEGALINRMSKWVGPADQKIAHQR